MNLHELWPDKWPEPTAVGAVRSAGAVHAAPRRWLSFLRSLRTKLHLLSVWLCLGFVFGCNPPGAKQSAFLAAFDPVLTLNQLGNASGIAYVNGTEGSSFHTSFFNGTAEQRQWTFSFQGSHAQLSGQLDKFQAEVERQLVSAGTRIRGRSLWSDRLSGFTLVYTSPRRGGFLTVTGASVETNQQALEVIIYEHSTSGEPSGPADGSQPIRPETNRTSSAADSLR